MEFSEVVRKRRMVRHYTAEPVGREQLTRLIQAALHAPSAGFTQAQSYLVVTDPGVRAAIAGLAGEPRFTERGFAPWISSAPALVIPCTSEEAYRRRYAEDDKLGPDAALEWPVPFWFLDAGCGLMALLLATVDAGLAAGFLRIADPPAMKALLGIPEQVEPIGIVTIGHPAADRRSGSLRRGRRPEAERLRWERW